MKKLLIVIAVAALILGGYRFINSQKQSTMHMENDSMMKTEENAMMLNEGEMAADFSLVDLNGDTFQLSEQKGKKVYVKFWASWCPVCLASLSETDELSKMSENFEVVTVVSPGNLGEMKTTEFKKWFSGLSYPNVRVLLDEDGTFVKNYGIRSTPTNLFIGSDGVLVKRVPGQLAGDVIGNVFKEIK